LSRSWVLTPFFRVSPHEEPATGGTGPDLFGPQPRRPRERVVERVADQDGHPAAEHHRLAVALDQCVAAGGEEAEELGRLGEAERVRLGDGAERGDDAV